jgi:hypothetical protein
MVHTEIEPVLRIRRTVQRTGNLGARSPVGERNGRAQGDRSASRNAAHEPQPAVPAYRDGKAAGNG